MSEPRIIPYAKKMYYSRTLGFNGAVVAALMVAAQYAQEWISNNPESAAYVGALAAAANLFLRALTGRPLEIDATAAAILPAIKITEKMDDNLTSTDLEIR